MLNKSIELAIQYHKDQLYGNKPYLAHLFNVFILACEYTNSELILSASILHDILEDTELPKSKIENIDKALYAICILLSKNHNKKSYYENIALNKEASFVKIADRICNIKESLKQRNKKMVIKYFKEIPDYHKLNNELTAEIFTSEFLPLIKEMEEQISTFQILPE
jgi:(p)ppGpp synthase/HD superfamily hydrolase